MVEPKSLTETNAINSEPKKNTSSKSIARLRALAYSLHASLLHPAFIADSTIPAMSRRPLLGLVPVGGPFICLWVPHSSRWYRDEWGLCPFTAAPGPMGFYFNRTSLACSPVPKTRPWPIFGLGDQSPADRIAVDVPQLLHELSLCEDIEVIVPRLPEPVP